MRRVRVGYAGGVRLLLIAVLMVASACGSSSNGAKSRQCLGPPPAVDVTQPEISFSKQVAPIIQTNCALSACHADMQVSLGIYLPKDNAQIYKAFHAPATGNLKLDYVKAGSPADSYVMHKLDGTHCALDKDCVKGSCGSEMPPGETLPIADRDTIRRWIAQGAKDN
jgi:hypothetical protein